MSTLYGLVNLLLPLYVVVRYGLAAGLTAWFGLLAFSGLAFKALEGEGSERHGWAKASSLIPSIQNRSGKREPGL
jgi:hypothetical protein